MDDEGVTPKELAKSIVEHPGHAFRVAKVFSYRSTSRVTGELILDPAPGREPWRAVSAELVGPSRRALWVKPPWQSEPLRYEVEDRRVVIEAEVMEAETRGSFTLKVWDDDGTRTLILTGLTFP